MSEQPYTILDVFVSGDPAPQGSKKAFTRKESTKVQLVEASKRVEPWRSAIVARFATLPVMCPVEGPVEVWVDFYFRRPASNKSRYPTSRAIGDIDKLLRSTYDGLVMAGILADDSLIVGGWQNKRWAFEGSPGAQICVQILASE